MTKGLANLSVLSSAFKHSAAIATMSSGAACSPDVSLTNELSFQRIIEAIRANTTLALLKKVIEMECSNNANLSELLTLQSQWDLIVAAVRADRGDALEVLLQKGISPDIKDPSKYFCLTALQLAAELERLDLVKILLGHKANVNVGKLIHKSMFGHSTHPSMRHPNCENAMVVAFWHDNPVLMKLLLPGYDPSCIPDGKSPLYLAFRARAIKCITSLLTDPELQTVIDPSEVPLNFGFVSGQNLIPMLYEVGCRQGVYSSDDLNRFLSDITHIPNTGTCSCLGYGPCIGRRNRSCPCKARNLGTHFHCKLEELMATLLDLGADVNFTSPETKTTPLEGVLKAIYFKTDSDTVKGATCFLLNHKATARFSVVNGFFLHLCTTMLQSAHVYAMQHIDYYILDMMHLLHAPDNLKLIKGWRSRICDQEYPEPDHETIRDICCITRDESPLSQKVEEAIRLLVLNVDISFTELIKSVFKPGTQCPEERYMFLVQITSVLPHKAYQLMVRKVHMVKDSEAVNKVQNQTLSQHFPSVPPLVQLTRATVLKYLPFPRTISSEALGLPMVLQRYVCLKYR